MDAMIVVDMQVGLLNGAPKHDLEGVIERINSLGAIVRRRSCKVIWIRHCGRAMILSRIQPAGNSSLS